MNICVMIKEVVDVELNIRARNGSLIEEGLNYVISSWDEIAVEAAIQIMEAAGGGTITVMNIGPERATDTLRRALAMGADKAIHILDEALEGSDSFAFAKTFAKITADKNYDLILGGRQAEDTDAGLTMSMLAEFLDLPQATNISKIEAVDSDKLTLHRRGDNGIEIMEVTLPAVVTVNDSLFEPRLATMRGIMMAKKKPIETVCLKDFGMDPVMVGSAGRKTTVVRLIEPETRESGQLFEGDEEETTKQVLELLVNEDIGDENLFS